MDRAKQPMRSALPTERVNPRTLDLDQLGSGELLSRLLDEDRAVPAAVQAALPELTLACDALHQTLAAGGRWFNLGAGTSGRIGVLDAAEIPPTFGLPADRVRALIAGGDEALRHAVEGAEDDAPGKLLEPLRRFQLCLHARLVGNPRWRSGSDWGLVA